MAGEEIMRRSISIIAAAAIAAGVSAASLAPVQSAPRPVSIATSGEGASAVELIRHRRDRERHWRDDDGRRHWRQNRHRRHNRHFYPNQFYFGFPFAFAPPFYPHRGYQNCFRTWDGQLLCR